MFSLDDDLVLFNSTWNLQSWWVLLWLAFGCWLFFLPYKALRKRYSPCRNWKWSKIGAYISIGSRLKQLSASHSLMYNWKALTRHLIGDASEKDALCSRSCFMMQYRQHPQSQWEPSHGQGGVFFLLTRAPLGSWLRNRELWSQNYMWRRRERWSFQRCFQQFH